MAEHRLRAGIAKLAEVTAQEIDEPAEYPEHPRERHRGPVVLRRGRRDEETTTDQRLLDSRGPTDWVHTDPWRGLRIPAQIVEGVGAPAGGPPAVTGVGSGRPPRDHPPDERG